MKTVIQHNFSSGLGDCIVALYECIDTALKLKNQGHEVELFINQNRNLYFFKEDFFEIFNKDVFSVFDKINIILDGSAFSGSLKHIYTLGSASPGVHWWDLFAEFDTQEVRECVTVYTVYPYVSKNLPQEKPLFNESVETDYSQIKREDYTALYFRTYDFNEGDAFYRNFSKQITDILNLNKHIFVCSNSFTVKNMIKQLKRNDIFMNDICGEENFGNHWGSMPELTREQLILKTKQTIFDMFFLRDAKQINLFSEWSRLSNFLFFSKLRNVNINEYFL